MLRIPTLSEIMEVAQGRGRNSEAPEQWDGLAFDWPCQEGAGTKAFDVSGYGNHGTLTNMDPATDWVASPYGRALDFDTAHPGQWVDLHTNAYDLGIRRHATFYVLSKSNNTAMSHWLSDYNSLKGFTLRKEADETLTFYVYPNNHRINTTATIALGQWHCIVGVMDGANMYLYLDGLSVGSQTLGEDIGDSASSIKIGQRGDLDGPDAYGHTGPMALVGICNIAWNAARVRQFNDDPLAHLRLRRRVYPVAALSAFGGKSYILGGGNSCILGV